MHIFFLKKAKNVLRIKDSFTIIELIVVISIISVIAAIVLANLGGVREKTNVAAAGGVQRQMTKAVELYYADMGFYPPDVNRGWDPGLASPPEGIEPGTPWSPDAPSSGGFSEAGATCPDCPPDWQDIVLQNWHGPYLGNWPQYTPWRGKYDYNYWPGGGMVRYGCSVPPGVYMGVERDYDDVSGIIPVAAEEMMREKGFDQDGCPYNNGEAEMLLAPL